MIHMKYIPTQDYSFLLDENHYVYYKNNNGGVSLLLNKINNLKKYKKIFKKYILKT